MKIFMFAGGKPWPRFFFFLGFWLLYGVYYFGVNRLNAPDISLAEVVYSVPVFALIAHGVYAIIDRLLARNRTALGVVCLLTFYVAVTVLTNHWANTFNGWLEEPLNGGNAIPLASGAFLGNMVVMISQYSLYATAFFAVKRAVGNARAKQAEAEARLRETEGRLQAERERQRYEYVMLAGQVSPHFVANLLDGWRVQLGGAHRRIADAVERAYGLMVYYMEAHLPAKRRVPLAHEVAQAEAYAELARQHSRSKYISLRCEGEFTGYTVPPTTLLGLLENAAKHGRSDLPEHPVRMDVVLVGKRLSCACRNRVKDATDRASHGVGLANLRRRLELEYGNRFELEAIREGNEYRVQLTIRYP